jgi:hypothetical protein
MKMPQRLLLKRGLSSVNRVLRPIDAWFAANPAALPPTLFILGAPRSGTTLTYQIVTQHFQVGYMTAPLGYAHGLANALTRVLRPWLDRPEPGFRSHYGHIPGLLAPSEHASYWFRWFPVDGDLGHYLPPEAIDPADYGNLRSSLDSLAAILARPWVFKNLYLTMTAGALARILPEARFMVVRRNPLLVCQSILHRRERQSDPRQWWSTKPPHYRAWFDLPLCQQVARQAFLADAIPRRDLQRYAPERTMEVDYADLCRRPKAWLARLTAWLQPLGYRSYGNSRIPAQFPASEELTLDSTTTARIQSALSRLSNQQSHAFLS